MSQYGVIWMEEALQKLQQENTRLRQENAKLRQEWDQLLEALEEIARFQSDEAAKLFARDFNFPLSEELKKRLGE